jgi:hypothetical protein
MNKKLILNFYNHQLVETYFSHPLLEKPKIAIRGKTNGVFAGAGTFQWTNAVKAFAILCFKTKVSTRTGDDFFISGHFGSYAASLDYAVSKEPNWLIDMLGCDSKGNSLAKRMINRTNPNMKRPGPIYISINKIFIDFQSIKVIINGCEVVDDDLVNYYNLIAENIKLAI